MIIIPSTQCAIIIYIPDYIFCWHSFQVPSCVDIVYLFGNMEEIADVSQRLLTSLESATSGKEFQDQIVGKFSYIIMENDAML